jgi:hypothetical protein
MIKIKVIYYVLYFKILIIIWLLHPFINEIISNEISRINIYVRLRLLLLLNFFFHMFFLLIINKYFLVL